MEIPNWADEQLSKDLPFLRSKGEGQNLEYKITFPQNTRDLAKEVAAFATSNQGTILIGVSDSGDLIGINGAEKQEERDNLLKRLEGICRGTVKPAITPVAKFAVEDEQIVLVINVPHGKQPIYYSNNIPYVRHLTESRPAEPHEVLELIADFVANQSIGKKQNTDEPSIFYSNLAKILVEALIYADQADDRMINPWLDQWRSEFNSTAAELRNLSVQEIAINEKIVDELKEVASALEEVSSLRLTLGCGPELKKLTEKAREKLIALRQKKVDHIPLSEDSKEQVRSIIITTARKLEDLIERSQKMVEAGKIQDLQTAASALGYELLKVSQYNIDDLGEGFRSKLAYIGRELHLVETMSLYMDGGKSIQAILNKISNANNLLGQLVVHLQTS